MPFTTEDLQRIQGYKKDYGVVSRPISIADKPRIKPQGTLMKTLDYLIRPLYASAGFTNAIVQGKSTEQALVAAKKGIMGEERIFYSEVLKNAGVKNKYVRAIGGFALDVGLDPVTYLTFGVGVGAKMGLTTLNKGGITLLNRTLTRQLPKLTNLNITKGVSKDIAGQMARESVEEAVLRTALKQPEKYMAESAVRLLGKKVPIVSDMWKYAGKKVSPTLEKFHRVGPVKYIGEHFIGDKYIIKHAKGMTPLQKNLMTLHHQQERARELLGGELALQKSLLMAREVPKMADRELIANAIEQAAKKKVSLGEYFRGTAQFRKFYRGGTRYHPLKVTSEGVSLTTNKKVAERFARKGGIVEELYVAKNAKILDASKVTKKDIAKLEYPILGEVSITDFARSKGYDAIDFSKRSTYLGIPEAELKVINKSIIKEAREISALVPEHLIKNAEDLNRFIVKEIGKPEARQGLITSFKEGYVPHYYKQKLSKLWGDIPHPIIARNKHGRVRIFETMSEAVDAGWQPIEDYAVSVGLRNAYSKKVIAVDDYVQKTLSNVATPISKKSVAWKQMLKTQRVPEGMGLYMPRGGARFSPLYNSGKTKEIQLGIVKSMKKLEEKEGKKFFTGGALLEDLRLTPVGKAFKISDDIPVYLMPKEIADMMNAVSPYLTTEKGARTIMKFYDKTLNMWKTSVTVWFPGFHSRNAMSNAWLAFLGGLKNPQRVADATRIQRYSHLVNKGKSVKDFTIRLHGKTYKASELTKMGRESGVLNRGWFGAEMGETIEERILRQTGVKPTVKGAREQVRRIAGIPTNVGRKVGTAVENNARFSLFLDQIDKGIDVGSAARHTKKFLFDYGELTDFEKKYMKRIIPFYTWMRKNIPLEIEQLFRQPGKFAAVGKTKAEIESLSKRPDERYLPDYMREQEMFVRLPYESPDKPSYMNFDFAFQDLAKLSTNPAVLRQWFASLAPHLKIPFEIITNYNMYFGRELVDKNLPAEIKFRESTKEALMNNLRIAGFAKKLTREDLESAEKLLDSLLGLKAYPYDEAKSKYYYYQRKEQEQRALRKHQLKKEKKR